MDESCRKALYYFYVEHLRCPDRSQWYGTDGAISKTQRFWKSAFTFRQIENVFECIDVCIKNNIRYDGFSRKKTDDKLTDKVQSLVQKLNDIKDSVVAKSNLIYVYKLFCSLKAIYLRYI